MAEDDDDDDLSNGGGDFGCLRRQPSIRDRMKVNICRPERWTTSDIVRSINRYAGFMQFLPYHLAVSDAGSQQQGEHQRIIAQLCPSQK